MTGLVYEWAPIDRFVNEGVEDLLVLHWEEVGNDRDLIPYAPDWAAYRSLEKLKQFKALGAWRNGRLIGYNAFFIYPPPHYKHTLQAINDIIYIAPAERGEAGLRLVLTAERDLFKDGVVRISYHSKPNVLLGQEKGDSLDALEMILDLEKEFGLELPDTTLAPENTMGGMLACLGYRHVESVYDKVRRS